MEYRSSPSAHRIADQAELPGTDLTLAPAGPCDQYGLDRPSLRTTVTTRGVRVLGIFPGFVEDDVSLSLGDRLLFIQVPARSAERDEVTASGSECVVVLPFDVDLALASASYRYGVLTVDLPRVMPERAPARPIP